MFPGEEVRLGKDRQAKVDRRSIQGANRVLQFHGRGFLLIELPGNADQMMGEIGVDLPVPRLVRFRQSAARNLAADAHLIEFFEGRLLCPAGFRDTSVGRKPGAELVQIGEILDAEITSVPFHTVLKGFQRHEVHDLSKHRWLLNT